SMSSNLIALVISTLVIFILPKYLGVEEYGYWQLYIFYSTYVGLSQLGWNDGIYLRYGGIQYDALDKKTFFSQFIMMFGSQTIFGILIWIYTIFFIQDLNKDFIIIIVSISMVILNTRVMLLYILQATNRIKDYARITLSDKMIFIILVIIFLFFGIRDFKVIIYSDVIGKFFSLIYAMFLCKEIVFNKVNYFYLTINEMVNNVAAGIKLMFANVAGLLIVGVVRLGIERTWDITTFGKVSLTLSISNLLMVFINAVGIIIFPVLRRTSINNLPSIYMNMKTFLMIPLIGVLVVYYPLKTVLAIWLPQYAESLIYMALLFPICVFEGKMALLINTYLKTLRKEKVILMVNIISLILSIILTLLFTFFYKNIIFAILSIVIVLAVRSVIAEILLSKILKIFILKDLLLELLMVFIFIIASWYLSFWLGLLFYLSFYGIYIFIKRKDIGETLKYIKRLVRKEEEI
ncbi:hypothetical protein QMA04_04105, partial [Planococcus sp. APC 3900]|uniref:hypothetical protein n=1 Tax=Planococcus sp. APC 3900 TaxID=3035191 RepID=UPI0025B4D378